MTVPVSSTEWVWLARIRRPQGRKGEVFAEILTDFPEKFADRRQLWLLHESGAASHHQIAPPQRAQLAHHWLHKGGVVLHFAGVDSISSAETLSGLIVAIPRELRAELPEGEVHIADLIGCALIDVTPEPPSLLGQIENVDRTAGPVPLLIVKGDRGEILVPFAQSFLRKLDIAAARIEMALPEGLADLNI